MKILKIVLCVMTALFMVGCNFSEGDETAKQSFELMNSQEKAMHDLVMKEFNEKAVLSVREAVRTRKAKPPVSATPFTDIAGVIKHCNDAILIPRDFWSNEDSIDEAQRAKFSSQDGDWYRKIVKISTGENYVEPIKQVASEPIKIDNFDKKFEIAKVEEKRVVLNPKDLLPLDKYQDVKFLARGCEQAISIIESAASQDRPLTEEDFKNIQYEKAVCETKKLNENL